MLIDDILYRVLAGVCIIAVVLLIVVLWKINKMMKDLNETSSIAKKRVKQLDSSLDVLEKNIDNASSIIKGFVSSLETSQKIKAKIKSFWD